MSFRTLNDFDLQQKTILLRCDLNVPTQDGKVTDTSRIDRLKPTIDYLRSQRAKIVLLSHFGRPKGQRNLDFSLSFLPKTLETQWQTTVCFAEDCVGDAAQNAVNSLNNGEVLLLENLRFHADEEKNNPDFSQKLAALGDIYINDAFSCSHRAHASTQGITAYLPAAAGRLMESELNALETALEKPKQPVLAIVGGSKISTKLSVLKNIVRKCDYLILGGAMPNTFLLAQGINIGASMCESDMTEEAKEILLLAEKEQCEIILPTDCLAVTDLHENAAYDIADFSDFPGDKSCVDLGPNTTNKINTILNDCQTVLWNGPLGVFEIKPFDQATNKVAQHVAKQTKAGKIRSVAGGGDTVAALSNAGVTDDFSYISTAGGAFLEWLEGKELPGVAALTKNNG